MVIILKSRVIYKSILAYLTICVAHTLYAKSTVDTNRIVLQHYFNTQYGFIIVHRSSVQHFSQTHFSVFQYSLLKQTKLQRKWEKEYNAPRVGANFIYTNFAHNTLLNSAFGAQACIDFSRHPFKKNAWHFNIGCGIGYIQTPFDKTNNFKNIAIGSHFNGLIQLALSHSFQLSKQVSLASQVSIIHFSNGAIKVPNLGINIASAGLTLMVSNKLSTALSKEKIYRDSIKSKSYVEVIIGGGVKQNYPAGSANYGVTALRIQKHFWVKQKKSVSAGLDAFYDNGIYARMRSDGYSDEKKKTALQLGLNFQYQQHIGKVSIPLFWGTYLFSHYRGNGIFYHGTGIKYQVNKQMQVGIILKTHFAKADYFWWNMGYTF